MDLLGRIYDRIITGLAVFAGLILVMIFLFVMQDVILRNLLISPPPWSAPMAEYGLLYITLLTAPWLVRTRGHVVLEVVRQRLSRAAARKLEIVVYILCVAMCVVMSWFSFELWLAAWYSGEEDHRAIEIPRTWLFAPAIIAFPLMTCEFLRYLFGRDSLYHPGPPGGEGA